MRNHGVEFPVAKGNIRNCSKYRSLNNMTYKYGE